MTEQELRNMLDEPEGETVEFKPSASKIAGNRESSESGPQSGSAPNSTKTIAIATATPIPTPTSSISINAPFSG